MANSEIGLQRIMEKMDQTTKKYNMKINLKKTKVMKVNKEGSGEIDIKVNNTKL